MNTAKTIEIIHNPNGVVEVFFSHDVHERLEDAFHQTINLAQSVEREIAISQFVFAGAIGVEALIELSRLGSLAAGEGAIVFHIPHDRGVTRSPRPEQRACDAKSTGIVERMLLSLSQFFGFAYAVKAEDPQVIGHLIPRQQALDAYTGEGSRQELSFHSENAIWRHLYPGFDLSPRALLLAGISEQRVSGPETGIAIVARAVPLIDPVWAERLRRPCAYLNLPYRHRREGGIERVGPVPILLGTPGREELCGAFYPGMVEFDNVADEIAFSELALALREVRIGLKIVPGVCVSIMNGTVLHDRSAFSPVFNADGSAERWVERLFTHARPESLMHFAHNGERVFNLTLPA